VASSEEQQAAARLQSTVRDGTHATAVRRRAPPSRSGENPFPQDGPRRRVEAAQRSGDNPDPHPRLTPRDEEPASPRVPNGTSEAGPIARSGRRDPGHPQGARGQVRLPERVELAVPVAGAHERDPLPAHLGGEQDGRGAEVLVPRNGLESSLPDLSKSQSSGAQSDYGEGVTDASVCEG